MAEELGAWTTSQKTAAGFAWSAASQGLTQAGGLEQYRAGGGAIRTADWNELFRSSFAIVGWREDVAAVPLHWAIPERMFETRDVDWTQKYNFVAEVEYYNKATQQWETKHVQAGADELPTHAEWREEVLTRMLMEAESPAIDLERGVRWITEEVMQRRWP